MCGSLCVYIIHTRMYILFAQPGNRGLLSNVGIHKACDRTVIAMSLLFILQAYEIKKKNYVLSRITIRLRSFSNKHTQWRNTT